MMELAANEDVCDRNRTALTLNPPTPSPPTHASMVNVAPLVRRTMAFARKTGMMTAFAVNEEAR